MKHEATKDVWVVWTNTDRTEGRGEQIVHAVCDIEATALRFAKGCSVQGSDGPVTQEKAHRYNNRWYAPAHIISSSEEDDIRQKVLDAHHLAIKKARDLGMTDEEIQAIRNSW